MVHSATLTAMGAQENGILVSNTWRGHSNRPEYREHLSSRDLTAQCGLSNDPSQPARCRIRRAWDR